MDSPECCEGSCNSVVAIWNTQPVFNSWECSNCSRMRFSKIIGRGNNQKELAATRVFEWWQYRVFVAKNARPEQLQTLRAIAIPITHRRGVQRREFDCD